MKIYMKDGMRATISNDENNPIIVSFDSGYVHVKQYSKDMKESYTRLTVPKENLIFIDYENEGNDGKIERGHIEIIGAWD